MFLTIKQAIFIYLLAKSKLFRVLHELQVSNINDEGIRENVKIYAGAEQNGWWGKGRKQYRFDGLSPTVPLFASL